MRRFNFYDREALRAPALQVLDVTAAASGRGTLVLGDSEGHVVMVDRNFRAQAFQAHKTRVNAVYQLKNSPVLVTIGDGADPRPSHIRAAARSAVLAAREKASKDVESERESGGRGADGEDDGEDGEGGGASSDDVGLALGLGVPLNGVASALQRGDATWDAGYALNSPEPPIATLKVWRLDQRDPRTGMPECVRTSRVFSGPPKEAHARERVVTSLAVSEDCTQVAVGCGDGAVLLLRGDLLKGERAVRNKRGIAFNLGLGGSGSTLKPQLLYEAPEGGSPLQDDTTPGVTADALTCVAYSVHADPGVQGEPDRKPAFGSAAASSASARRPKSMLCLYATTAGGVRCYFPTDVRPAGMGRGWGPGEAFLELGSPGAGPGCAVLGDGGELVVGNDGGVFFYSPEERKGAYTLPGRKQRLAWFRGCLVAATEEAGAVSVGPGGRRVGGEAALLGASSSVTVTVYDLRSKFVAYTMSLGPGAGASGGGKAQQAGPGVRFILPEWGQLFVMVAPSGGDGGAGLPSQPTGVPSGGPLTVMQLSEKDTASKVDTLCRLHLFDMALQVAGSANYGKDALADISRGHGDHLYSRGDFDGAVAQYCKTIGFVEPSYVIRRFLDSARVGNLAAYLEALHGLGSAESDHTTLLLNCYTKMGAQEKLRTFIRGQHPGEGGKREAGEATFDVRVAISVLRDAGCVEEATWLAQAHGEHDLYLALLLLPGSAGTGAMNVEPVAFPPPSPGGATTALSFLRRLPFLDAEFYAKRYGRLLLAAHPGGATDFLVSLATRWARVKPHVQGSAERPGGVVTLASLGLGTDGGAAGALRERKRCDDVSSLLPLFADNPRELMRFLQAVTRLAAVGDAAPPPPAVWHAMLEVCLRRDVYSSEELGGGATLVKDSDLLKAQEESVITGILRNPSARYDAATALVLCQGAGYRPGCLVLFEKLGLKPLVLAHYMETAESGRTAGRHAESKAARRELVRRVKAMTEPGAGEAVGPMSGGPSSLALPEGDEGGVQAAGLWISVLRYLSRSYLDGTGAAVLPAAGSGYEGEPGDPIPGGESGTVRVTYPGLTGATLVREREEQDALLGDVLRHLDKATSGGGHLSGAIPALTILSVLSECPHLPFGSVRDFLVRRLGGEAGGAGEERAVLAELRADTEALQAEVRRLDTQPVVFQSRSCVLCGLELDLPSVHFLCGGGPQVGGRGREGEGGDEDNTRTRGGATAGTEEHTFHLHCVTDALSSNLGLGSTGGSGVDGEMQCPLCAGEQARVRAVMAGLGPKPGLAEQFYTSLDSAPDGFLKSAEYLSKGLYGSGQAV